MAPSPFHPSCSSEGCTVNFNDTAYAYRIDAFTRPVKHQAKYGTARFLAQTTFGASKHDLKQFESKYTKSTRGFNVCMCVNVCVCVCVCARAREHPKIEWHVNDTRIQIIAVVTHPVSYLSSFPETNIIGGAMSGISKWMDDQVSIKPTLHRAYYRERANPRTYVHQQVRVRVRVT